MNFSKPFAVLAFFCPAPSTLAKLAPANKSSLSPSAFFPKRSINQLPDLQVTVAVGTTSPWPQHRRRRYQITVPYHAGECIF